MKAPPSSGRSARHVQELHCPPRIRKTMTMFARALPPVARALAAPRKMDFTGKMSGRTPQIKINHSGLLSCFAKLRSTNTGLGGVAGYARKVGERCILPGRISMQASGCPAGSHWVCRWCNKLRRRSALFAPPFDSFSEQKGEGSGQVREGRCASRVLLVEQGGTQGNGIEIDGVGNARPSRAFPGRGKSKSLKRGRARLCFRRRWDLICMF
jgi:hypothetical protein